MVTFDKKVATIIIPYREKGAEVDLTFLIGFVSNYVLRSYNEWTQANAEVLLRHADLREAIDAMGALQKDERIHDEVKRTELKKLTARRDEIEIFAKEFKLKYENQREEIIREVLESNGYEYDSDIWDKRIDAHHVTQFIKAAVHKDDAEIKKK